MQAAACPGSEVHSYYEGCLERLEAAMQEMGSSTRSDGEVEEGSSGEDDDMEIEPLDPEPEAQGLAAGSGSINPLSTESLR